jgi:hypothetical protein
MLADVKVIGTVDATCRAFVSAAMVHVRLNEKESNPNPYVNFISSLDVGDTASQEDARSRLTIYQPQSTQTKTGSFYAPSRLKSNP